MERADTMIEKTTPRLIAMITCPVCGQASSDTMPTDACRYLYTCPHCATRLRPRPGDCCVFCSYGNMPCPPKRMEQAAPVKN